MHASSIHASRYCRAHAHLLCAPPVTPLAGGDAKDTSKTTRQEEKEKENENENENENGK